MTFKTWDLLGVFKEDVEGDLAVDLEGDFKQDMEGDLLSSSGQVWSRPGSGYSSDLIVLSIRAFPLSDHLSDLRKFPEPLELEVYPLKLNS